MTTCLDVARTPPHDLSMITTARKNCSLVLTLLMLWCLISQDAVAAGFRWLDAGDLTVGVWYPSAATERNGRLGPFDVKLAFDGAVRSGGEFQIIVFSHGNLGRVRNHHLTAQALADAGFIVIAPLHAADHLMTGDDTARVLEWRITELRHALERVLQEESFRRVIDLSRIHAIGYSLGAVTALNAGGAGFDLGAAAAHCMQSHDPAFCETPSFLVRWKTHFLRDTESPELYRDVPPRFFPLPFVNGGVAVVAPVGQGVIFDETVFHAQKIFIVGLADDVVTRPEFHAHHLADMFPEKYVERFSLRPGHHSAFIAPFAKRVTDKEDIPAAKDPPGFDRKAFLDSINRELVAFFVRQARRPL